MLEFSIDEKAFTSARYAFSTAVFPEEHRKRKVLNMSTFSIKGSNLDGLIDQEADFTRQLEKTKNDIDSIISKFAYYGAGRARCLRRLKAVSSKISTHKRSMEMMREALSQGVKKYQDTEKRICGNAKTGKFQYNDINKPEAVVKNGNEHTLDDPFYLYIKAILKYKEKFNDDENAGISWGFLNYMEGLRNFWDERSEADFFDLGQSSSELWTAYYEYLSKQDSTELFEKKWGKRVAGVSVAGSIMGLISAVYDTAEQDNDTFSKKWDSTFDILEEGTDVIKDGYEWWNYEELLKGKEGIHSTAGKYAILAKTLFSVAGQAGKSIERYSEDGSWSMDDTARTMIESSVAGLESMVSGLTFGIISAETFGVSVDDICKNLEDGTQNLGQQAADYIKEHEDMYDRWNKGSELDKAGLICEALFKKTFSI